jgi:hypothetical protein
MQYATTTGALRELSAWSQSKAVAQVAMEESTGVYCKHPIKDVSFLLSWTTSCANGSSR